MRLLTIISLAVVLMTAGAALAQPSGQSGYTKPGDLQSPPAQSEPSDDGGGLPFSGSDLIVLAGGGVVLVLSGLTLGRLTKHPRRQTQHRAHS
jgi:hypothetical protein